MVGFLPAIGLCLLVIMYCAIRILIHLLAIEELLLNILKYGAG